MKKLPLLLSTTLLTLVSCSNIDFDLTPLNYDETVPIEIAYDIQTEGNDPYDNLIFSKCNSFVYKYFVDIKNQRFPFLKLKIDL